MKDKKFDCFDNLIKGLEECKLFIQEFKEESTQMISELKESDIVAYKSPTRRNVCLVRLVTSEDSRFIINERSGFWGDENGLYFLHSLVHENETIASILLCLEEDDDKELFDILYEQSTILYFSFTAKGELIGVTTTINQIKKYADKILSYKD